jgi:hypothetical protein
LRQYGRDVPAGRFRFETVEPLHANFPENPRRETLAGRIRFAVKQAFQSEDATEEGSV